MSVETTALASSVLALVGGVGNVSHVGRCLVRLRLRLTDPALADVDAIGALPGVALAIPQAGEVHIAPRTGLDELHRTVAAVVAAHA